MSKFDIRPYKKGDEISINKNFNKVFDLGRSLEEWRWKMQPGNKHSCIMVAVDKGDDVVAHCAGFAVPMIINGEVVLCGQSFDYFSLRTRDTLKERIFLKTYNGYCNLYCGPRPERMPFWYGCVGGRHLKLGKLVMNYTGPFTIPYLYRKTNMLLRARGLFLSYGMKKYYTDPKELKPSAVDDLSKRSLGRHSVAIIKDSEYLKRRYFTRPHKKYQVITVENNGSLRCLAVLHYDKLVFRWVDLIWDGEDPEDLTALGNRIYDTACSEGATKIEMWLMNDDRAKDVLISCGMKVGKNPYDLFIVTNTFAPGFDAYELGSKFCFTMGDSDMF